RFESVRAFAEALETSLTTPTASTPPPPPIEDARSSERHVKATLKLEKFRMPTLENSAPSGMQPLPQKTQKLPPARIPPPPPTSIVVPPPPKPEDEPATDVDALGPNESELEVVCTPTCEKVLVDGKLQTQYPAPIRLTPGRHGIGVGKTGYGGQYKLVYLKPS